MQGKFITFEGGECTGKTTIIKLLKEELEKRGFKVLLTREPGGTKISEQIRNVILSKENVEMLAETEAMLYAASRYQHLNEKIVPALKEGYIVLCDRFLDSSLVYQGIARNLGIEHVLELNKSNLTVSPDKTILISLKPEIALKRLDSRNTKVDRLDSEGLEFHQMVYEGYLELAKRFKERISLIDGNQTIEEVYQDVLDVVNEVISK